MRPERRLDFRAHTVVLLAALLAAPASARGQVGGRIVTSGVDGVHTMNPDGNGRAKLDATPAIGSSADGCKIASIQGSHDIVVTDADGSSARSFASGALANQS